MGRIYIAGAGLAGLACALRLVRAGAEVTVLEAARHAGGRCRSFHEKTLGTTIDNGNHLLLSGNTAAMSYLETVGARDRLVGPDEASFPFVDLADGTRWTVAPNSGRVPWWIFNRDRRVAGTRPGDYLGITRLLRRHPGKTFGEVSQLHGVLYERFWDPFIVAVLNTLPQDAAAELITPVLWETFAKGASACRPLVARDGLSDTFIDPALAYLEGNGCDVRFGARVARLTVENDRIASLECGGETKPMAPDDTVVLAVPAPVARDLAPVLTVPQKHSAIVNLHYRLDRPAASRDLLTGLVNGLAQWLFVRGDIASVTISAANAVADREADELSAQVWKEIAPLLGLPVDRMPPCRVIKERRATFLQTPEQVALRPAGKTGLSNLVLAGDWTDTGLPATIEGAIRSGHTAAALTLSGRGRA